MLQKLNELGNFRKISEQKAILSYDTSIYNSETINAVAHYMIGKCNSIITKDTDDDKKILVEISIDGGEILGLIDEFNEEVINFSFYNHMMENKGKLREVILERVLLFAKDKTEPSI